MAISLLRFVTLYFWLHQKSSAFGSRTVYSLKEELSHWSLLRVHWSPLPELSRVHCPGPLTPSCPAKLHSKSAHIYFIFFCHCQDWGSISRVGGIHLLQSPKWAIGSAFPRRLDPAGSHNSFRRDESCTSVSAVKSEKTDGLLVTA